MKFHHSMTEFHGIRRPRRLSQTALANDILENSTLKVEFSRMHGGAELDLLLIHGQRRFGFEMKWGDAPAITKSMRNAIEDLNLESLAIVYPGDRRTSLDKRTELVPLAELDDYLRERKLVPPVKLGHSKG